MKNWHIKCKNREGKSLLDTLLEIRGIREDKEIKCFLNPLGADFIDADAFSDMQKAYERILKAINNNEHILIWGDFDADGVTATALLYKTLKELGANFDFIIPDREDMGHGLNSKCILPYVAKKKLKLLITVDCGISNTKEIALLKGLGVDVIVTDHHDAPDILPDAYAILNPKAPDALKSSLSVQEINSLSNLAGVGVAHKLALKLLSNNNNLKLKDELLCLACTGTIADVVPLLNENRTICAKGLKLINEGAHKGIGALFKSAKKEGIITSYDVAFILAPRINAAGRLGSPIEAFELLVEDDDTKIANAVKTLENYNKVRQSLCEKTLSEADEDILNNPNFNDEPAVVLFNEQWHIGIIGIVASKIAEKYLKPVFMITKDDKNQARCSIRGVKGYNIHSILEDNSKYFSNYGGHELAGGFSLDLNLHGIEDIKKAILTTVKNMYDENIEPYTLEADMELEVQEITESIIESVNMLEPTGAMNQSPVFVLNNVELVSKKPMGKDENHIMYKCKRDNKEFTCVWWRHNDIEPNIGEKFDIAFHLRINIFNGEETLRLDTVDIRHNNKSRRYKIYDHRMKKDILASISGYLENPPFEISIWAKKQNTKNLLKDYAPIYTKISDNEVQKCKGLMFFDYPSSVSELKDVFKKSGAEKIHLMGEKFDENIEIYVRQLIGMLKYASSQKEGRIDIRKMAELLGLNENFIQTALEILENMESIEILDIDRINFIKAPSLEAFYANSMFEILNDEFVKIKEFKKYLACTKTDEIENLLLNT